MLGRLRKVAAVFFLLASTAVQQDLAPELLLLSRIKRHLREQLARTPNYTCLETISRFRNDPKSVLQSHKGLASGSPLTYSLYSSSRSRPKAQPQYHCGTLGENPSRRKCGQLQQWHPGSGESPLDNGVNAP